MSVLDKLNLSGAEQEQLINEIVDKCIAKLEKRWGIPSVTSISEKELKKEILSYHVRKDAKGNVIEYCYGFA